MKQILIILFVFIALIGCTSSRHLTPDYVVIIVEQEPCDHFFVSQTIEITDGYFDSELTGLIEQYKKEEGWPCICIYCHTIKQCY